jgi:hypothetical protein
MESSGILWTQRHLDKLIGTKNHVGSMNYSRSALPRHNWLKCNLRLLHNSQWEGIVVDSKASQQAIWNEKPSGLFGLLLKYRFPGIIGSSVT